MSQSVINVADMDFFQLKLLNDKEADFYTRDGLAFFYIGGQKYCCGESNPDNKGLKDGIKASGPIIFWQRDEFWVLSFLDRQKSVRPVVIRAGNVLTELEQ